jgi:predicted DsbA family dithiol-disulfide isomerase
VLFRTHFEDHGDLGDLETLLRIGGEAGLDVDDLREALETGRYRQQVDHRIAWAQSIGITGVPTFIINERYGVVGAQPYEVFERVMEELGVPKRNGSPDGG